MGLGVSCSLLIKVSPHPHLHGTWRSHALLVPCPPNHGGGGSEPILIWLLHQWGSELVSGDTGWGHPFLAHAALNTWTLRPLVLKSLAHCLQVKGYGEFGHRACLPSTGFAEEIPAFSWGKPKCFCLDSTSKGTDGRSQLAASSLVQPVQYLRAFENCVALILCV